MKRLRKGRVALVIGLAMVCVGLGVFYFMNIPRIEFDSKHPKIEIHSDFDAAKNITKVRDGKSKDVKIDTSKINKDKLGKYEVTYTIDKDTYTIEVEIVDTKAPTFDINDLDLDVGMNIEATNFVSNIVDDTKTTAKFKEKYTFDKEGTQKVVVIVSDEGGNVAEKKASLTLVKDQEKPSIEGIDETTVRKGAKIDYQAGVIAKDNRDPEPKIEVDDSKVKINTVGTYEVVYTVTDRSGNSVQVTRKISVVENKNIGSSEQSNEKVVYLTFDDGPSGNTAKILDILDRYNAKATFFVTGRGQNHNYLIKDAHDRGHTIGLHTYTHDYATVYASPAAYFNDLDQIGNMVKDLIGFVPKYIRFPGGASNTVSRRYSPGIMSTLTKEVINRGYQYYDWNAGTGDASGNNVPVSSIISQGTSSGSTNIMILAHDTQAKSTTVEALPAIIEHYQRLGYRFAGIDDNTFAPHQQVNN